MNKLLSVLALAVIVFSVDAAPLPRPGMASQKPHETTSKASVRVTTLSLKTYPFSDPETLPATAERRYPYFRYDRTSATAEQRDWQAVILENAETRVTILPQVGGKVWAATDKVAGRDFLYCNRVMKFRDIAQRGPWLSGGIEFNFGTIGHAPSTSTPVDWFVATNSDGSVSCFVGSREYATRTVWQVEIRLGAEARDFETHTTWYNGSGLPEPLYHWMNAAYSVRNDPEFHFPGETVIGHDGKVLTDRWPFDNEGHHIGDFRDNQFGGPKSYHVLPGNNGFYGIWWPDLKFGSYHRSAPTAKMGRKLWLWALSREGGIWEDLLTDSDGQYTELQSGLCFNQPQSNSALSPFKHPTFAPGATMAFTEQWGSIRDRKEINKDVEVGSVEPRPHEMPADFDWSSAYGKYMRGVQYLRERFDGKGAAELREALDEDPNLSPALTALAGYEMRRGNYDEVHRLAGRALAVNAYDAEANYLDGYAYFLEGIYITARERLAVAALNAEFRDAANALIGRANLRHPPKSPGPHQPLTTNHQPLTTLSREALLIKLISLRGTPEAAPFAREVLARFPLMHAARYELQLAGGETDFTRYIRSELPNEELKEIALWYLETGLESDAKAILARTGVDFMARVLAGDYTAAKKLSVAGVMPFRREELIALERAVAKDDCWKFRYLLAVVKAYFNYNVGELLEGCGDKPDEAVFYRYRARFRTGDAQLADLRRAALLGDDWRIGRELYQHFADAGDWSEALATTTDYLARYPDCNPLQIAHANAFNRNGRYAETIAFLKGVTILPSEHGANAAAVWHEAEDALGLRRSWPENLGRGKPYGKVPELTVGVASSMEAIFPRGEYRKPVTDAHEARVRLARGEYESFQLIVTCQESDLKNVKVVASDLKREESALKPWPAATFPKDAIACDVVGYAWTEFPTNASKYPKTFSVVTKTDKPPYYQRGAENAKDAWWPDPILDFLDGVEIARNDVQSFWIRLHCPAKQPAGVYRGTLTVSADGVEAVELPLVVRVNNFAVPKASPLPLAITYAPMAHFKDDAKAEQAEVYARTHDPEGPIQLAKSRPMDWANFLADYYITFDNLYTRTTLNFEVLDELERQGRLGRFNLGYWDYFKDGEDAEEKWRAETLPRLRKNYEKAKVRGWLDRAYIYGCDEISPKYFDNIVKALTVLKTEFPGVAISTTAYDHDYGVGSKLKGIDYFTPLTPKYDVEKAKKSRAEGHQVWWYICCGPGNPWANMFTQCQPLEARMLMGAQTTRMRPDGFLYYEVSIWNSKRPITSGPFTDWVEHSYRTMSGDGAWTAVAAGGRPLPTLRLENFRDGLEDYAYAKLLEEKLIKARAKARYTDTDNGLSAPKARPQDTGVSVSGRSASADPAWQARASALLAVPVSVMETMTNYTGDPAAIYAWRDAMADLIEAAD